MDLITISCSQPANHILTHLYNNQESHIPYTPTATVKYKNNVFLSQSKLNGRTNYSPRALVYDVRNGYGALSQFEYAQLQTIPTGYEIINTAPKIEKNEYQTALDKGINKPDALDTSNTTFWTDYNKLIFKPWCLNSLQSWELQGDKTVNKFVPDVSFSNFNVGQEEFSKDSEDTTDKFRKLLEQSDFFDGMQLFTELDSAWGGFTNEMLTNIKDEFFNYTSNNKFNIWIWSIVTSNKLDMSQTYTRIKGIVELSKAASLHIPLKSPNFTSNWQNGGAMSIPVNSMWELINSDPAVSSMKELETGLLGNDSNRNIVNNVHMKELKDITMNKLSLYDLDQGNEMQFGFNNNSIYRFSSQTILNEWDKELILEDKSIVYTTKNDILDITKCDTFPDILTSSKVSVHYSVDSSLAYDIKKYIEYVKKTPRLMEPIIGEKEELLQELYDLKKSYSTGPEFEQDSDQDDD